MEHKEQMTRSLSPVRKEAAREQEAADTKAAGGEGAQEAGSQGWECGRGDRHHRREIPEAVRGARVRAGANRSTIQGRRLGGDD